MRKIIIKWLFKYPMPKYFHAIVYLENIEWDKIEDTKYAILKTKKILNYELFHNIYKNNSEENFYCLNTKEEYSGMIKDYSELITKLNNVLTFGVMNPKQQNPN